MKGLIYVLAFTIGFAVGPASFPSVPSTFANDSGQSDPQSSSETAGSQDETPQPDGQDRLRAAVDPIAARVVIDAPTKGRVGELIRFDLTKSDAESIKWLLLPESVDFQTYEDGRRAVFSARSPGSYMFIIAVAKNGTVDVVTHTVRIEGPPKKPESQSLAEWIPYWLYPLQLPKEEALKLAESFEDVAARITALSTPKGIIEATQEANRASLGDSLPAWVPLMKKIQAALANQAKAGTLVTPEQHKIIWLEIAKGLRRYAN